MSRYLLAVFMILLGYGQSSFAAAIHNASKEGDLSTVKALVDRGQAVDQPDEKGFTPLHYAARNGHLEIVRLLVAKGARLDSKDGVAGGTPLHWAAYGGQNAIVSFLLEKGADPSAVSKKGGTPLDVAVAMNWPQVAEILKRYAAKGSPGTLHVRRGLNRAGDILIDNLHQEYIDDCTITLSGGFSILAGPIAPGDRLMLPAGSFKKADGTRYSATSGKPETISVTCLKPVKRSTE